jgi:hypothetical protein
MSQGGLSKFEKVFAVVLQLVNRLMDIRQGGMALLFLE